MGDEVAAPSSAARTASATARRSSAAWTCSRACSPSRAFDADRRSIGLEIELNLTEETGDPALANAHVLELIADADFQTELAQFNIEINIPPRKLEGAVFARARGDGPREPQPRRGAGARRRTRT